MGDAAGPLRVLLVVHHELRPGTGAAGSTLSIAEALEARGHRVEVVGLDLLARRRGDLADAVAFPHAVRRLVRRRLARADVDVVDASTGDLAYVARALVAASAAAVVTRSHGLEHLNARRRRAGARDGELQLRRRYAVYHAGLRLLEVRRSLLTADLVLTLNGDETRFAHQELGVDLARLHRTSELLRPLPAPDRARPSRDVLVLGPAAWRKGGDLSVRVLDAVLRASPRVTASWHGLDDPAAVRAQLGGDVSTRVELGGRYDAPELAALLAAHRVLLFPSRAEGLGMTVLEALTEGLPVVASDVAGPRDILEGGGGILVPDGHVEGMVAALLSLLDDDDRHARLVREARVRAEAYATPTVIDDLERCYREVLAAKPVTTH